MPTLPPVLRPKAQRSQRQIDLDRGSARQRGYSTRWDKASKAHRLAHPLCGYCEAGAFGDKRTTACTRVDHLYPHRRFAGVFWRSEWWVSSCDDCDAAKQSLEHKGKPALDALARRLGRTAMG